MSVLHVPGARLYYETHGSGPLLVMIPGAGGAADVFRAVTEHLAAHYTVVIYDRRGFSRSRLDGPQDYDRRLETDVDDVRCLVEHLGDEPATVFGASSGAIVALALLARHPSVVGTLVPFEPPLMRYLPGGQRWVDFFTETYGVYRESGVDVALAGFRERTFPASDQRVMARAPHNEANAGYWFEHELRQYPPAELDLDALKAHADRIVWAAGREGSGYPAHDVVTELAGQLGRNVIELPGGHVGFVAHPAEFAHELVRRLELAVARDPGSMSPQDWEDSYASTPHWDLGRPQPAFRVLADAGAFRGRVLDVGCGTGEHVLLCAALGLDATGVDVAAAPLRAAQQKARDRGLTARFLQHDVRALAKLGRAYDTVLDCGLFHIFGDEDRSAYLDSVRSVLVPGGRYFMLCFSDRQPGDGGPHRFTRDEITAALARGWRVDSIERTTLDSPTGGIHGWMVALTRENSTC
ncbi:alpha/beta fold hydrolase [Actinophytocola sp.]|uniref:alpha/beta fold hydrolase n=1 Tax=Actinophytocola sp. TaxID=1872138 RepID=UPI003899B208